MLKVKTTLLVTTALMVTLISAPLSAQTVQTPPIPQADSTPEESGADIIVTAQRRAERLIDVPVSITAISGATLERGNATGVFDITKTAPGVVINRNGGYLQPTIRGIGTNVTGGTADPNVAIYLDGVYQPSQTGNFFDLANIQSVEILKGPQGTLFGRNATGGAILITTADPSFTPSGRMLVSYGRYNEARGSAYLTTGLTDTLAIDLSAYYRRSDGFKHDVRTGDLQAKQHSLDLRSKLLFQPTETIKFVLTASYNDTSDPTGLAYNALNGNTQGRPIAGSGPIAEGRTQLSHNLAPVIRSKATAISLHADFDLGFATLRSISAYRDEKTHIEADLDASYAAVQQAIYDQPLRTQSQEFTLTSPSTGKFNWVTGLFYYHGFGHYPGYNINGVTALRAADTIDAYAVFADGTYKIGKFSLIAGLRYSDEKRNHKYGAGTGPYTVNANASFNDLTPRVGLRYAITDRSNLYATFSKGFKSGLFNGTAASTVAVKPEKVDAYELGYKVASRLIDFNAAGFYYNYDNIQVTAFDFTTGISRLFNAAKAEIYGIDADATIRPSRNFDLRVAAGYTHGRYTSFPGAIVFTPKPGGNVGNITQIVDASGSTMIRAPAITASATANYRVDIGERQIEFTATPYYTSKVNYTYDERIQQPGYFTLDASISYVLNADCRLSLWGKNLTDTTYASFRSTSSTRDSIVYATPRTYGVSASYRF
ncbi:TonB-dependent receptor (plasmid) [Sphingomonas paeninsulae]|uniref:TonB-dependent receptor n=1 Tax=Sphingomonas paeninsulae TaxID=2319844 RepID=A0A494TIB6_SPHPE|nr:TonB-dependent receptor [Sphingomonas paeninsulae]AYJ85168.1 TonB-dependent receptor [Sphingomonas paeninsulae]